MKAYACLVVLGASLAAHSARADDLQVISAAAAKDALAPLAALAQKALGETVRFSFGTAGEIRARALSGAPFDLVVAPPKVLENLAQQGAVAKGSRTDLGVVLLAGAVRKGAPKIDLSDEKALKASLLAAASIGIANPATGATSGIYLRDLMARLGVANAVKGKLKFYPDGQDAGEAVARGDIALALGQKSEFIGVPGAELAGLLPQSDQLRTIYAASLAKAAAGKANSRKLFDLLTSPEIKASFQAHGFDPPR